MTVMTRPALTLLTLTALNDWRCRHRPSKEAETYEREGGHNSGCKREDPRTIAHSPAKELENLESRR